MKAAGSVTPTDQPTNRPTNPMSETTDVNGDPIEQNKEYRLDFATGEMVPVEGDDGDDE